MGMKPYQKVKEDDMNEAFKKSLEELDEKEENVQFSIQIPEPEDVEIVNEGEVVEEEEKPAAEDSVERLASVLADRLAPPPTSPKEEELPPEELPPPVDMKKIEAEFNEKLHETDNPFELVMGSAAQVFGGQLAVQAKEIQQLKKEKLMADPTYGVVFQKWPNEVEKIVRGLPAEQRNNPEVYNYAAGQVMQKHMGEVINLRVDEAIAGREEAAPEPEGDKRKNSRISGQAGISGTGGRSTGGGRKKRRVPASELDKKMAKAYGMRLQDYLLAKGKI